MSNEMTVNLNNGRVVPNFLRFAFPLLVSNALQAIYNIVDMIIVGRFIGGAGISAVSVGSDMLHLLMFVAIGFSSAGQVIIARHVGAGEKDKIRKVIGTMFTFLFCVAVAISVVVFVTRNQMLHLLNTPEESYAYALDYLTTCLAGLVFIYGYNIVSAILRGMGDSTRPFIFISVAAVMNVVLDIVFVTRLNMEVFGAALATVMSQGVSFILAIVYLYCNRVAFGFDFKPKSFRISGDSMADLLALGIPMTIQSAAISVSRIILFAWVNSFGLIYSALSGISNKIASITNIFSMAFTAAGSTMIAQALGGQRYNRVKKIMLTALCCGVIPATCISLALVLVPDVVFSAFTTDTSVLDQAYLLVIPLILQAFGAATRGVAFGIINGSGRSKLNLLVALIDGFIGRIGLALLFGFAMSMGCFGLWLGDALAGFAPILIGVVFYKTYRWMEPIKKYEGGQKLSEQE